MDTSEASILRLAYIRTVLMRSACSRGSDALRIVFDALCTEHARLDILLIEVNYACSCLLQPNPSNASDCANRLKNGVIGAVD